MTIKDVTPGMIVKSKKGLTGRSTPYIDVDETKEYHFEENLKITIIEKPKRYGGFGNCVKYKVGDFNEILFEFWSDFKKMVSLI